jgi:hypothetical protein
LAHLRRQAAQMGGAAGNATNPEVQAKAKHSASLMALSLVGQ